MNKDIDMKNINIQMHLNNFNHKLNKTTYKLLRYVYFDNYNIDKYLLNEIYGYCKYIIENNGSLVINDLNNRINHKDLTNSYDILLDIIEHQDSIMDDIIHVINHDKIIPIYNHIKDVPYNLKHDLKLDNIPDKKESDDIKEDVINKLEKSGIKVDSDNKQIGDLGYSGVLTNGKYVLHLNI